MVDFTQQALIVPAPRDGVREIRGALNCPVPQASIPPERVPLPWEGTGEPHANG